MRCEICVQLLDDFVDGELPEIEHRNVEKHINACVRCDGEAQFLRTLSHDAGALPKSIQPDRDLWPGIEAGIAPVTRHHRRRPVLWGWRIPAAAVLAAVVLAGTYLVMRELTVRDSKQGVSPVVVEQQPSQSAQPPSVQSLDNRPEAAVEKKTILTPSPGTRPADNQPSADILTYPLEGLTILSISNYGIYGVRLDLSPSPEFFSHYILRFDQDGTQSWNPPLPPDSRPIAIYAGSGNRVWMAYGFRQGSQTFIDELDFGAEQQAKNIWKSGNLNILKFVMGPQGSIYAAGVRREFTEAIRRLTKGQSITAELVHIIDPLTGEERHLFPMTIRPNFTTPSWVGQTFLEMNALAPTIAVKSNGNFFLTIDRTRVYPTYRDLIKNEAVEYSPDGSVARTWKLGNLEPNAYLNRIFVDVDDSLLAEVLRYPDAGSAAAAMVVDRYLLRVDPYGRITRYQLSFPLDEVIEGWVGQTRDLVTRVTGKMIQSHRLH